MSPAVDFGPCPSVGLAVRVAVQPPSDPEIPKTTSRPSDAVRLVLLLKRSATRSVPSRPVQSAPVAPTRGSQTVSLGIVDLRQAMGLTA
ncbi:Protein of unknown function [Micromonospora lupini str. Lupac 08]|uniref:Uncharacterized protein n=1 Tax=Micromonospora lupini str. Lupac 08 TaxID=1150864 RepID=I0LE70_9ACTN|nr:Protein of unknown function [Micromonospora lupini str. Lupac 08]